MKKVVKKSIFFLIGIILFLIIWLAILSGIKKNEKKTKIEDTVALCQRAGCSGQLCVDSEFKNTTTTCEWKEEYVCYQKANCEKQKDGKCGFTKDDQFNKCIDELIKIEKIEVSK